MSAGTMIACASKEIIMGKHSNLNVGDIFTQTDREFSEIIVQVPKATECAYILVGRIDDTISGSSKLIFAVKNN